MTTEVAAKPWYKETWFWLLISPMLTLIVSVPIMLTTAFKGADDRVLDDYYKEGRMINNRFEAKALALEHDITASIEFDWVTGEAWLNANQPLPSDSLRLFFSHPAKADLDFSLTLKQVSAQRYRADIPSMARGRWYLELEGDIEGETWRISDEVNLAETHTVALRAAAH